MVVTQNSGEKEHDNKEKRKKKKITEKILKRIGMFYKKKG